MRPAILAVLVFATAASAHDVLILPSLCTFDPLVLDAPASGLEATAAAPTPSDTIRIVYDVAAGMAQFCPADAADPRNHCATASVPRAITGTISGTITLPVFAMHMLASGDLFATSVPVTLASGSDTASIPTTLTTGLVTVAGGTFEGAPIGTDGRFTLVGSGTATLPGALAGAPIVLRMTCTADPVPDFDQFMESSQTKAVAGTIKTSSARLRIAFRAGTPLAAGATAPDFTMPAIVRVSAGDATVASLVVPGGLAPQGRRKFVGQTADGQGSVIVMHGRGASYRLTVRMGSVTMPAASGRTPIDVTFQVGGLVSRTLRTFHGNGKGLRAP
jgi:hypothetical protein